MNIIDRLLLDIQETRDPMLKELLNELIALNIEINKLNQDIERTKIELAIALNI